MRIPTATPELTAEGIDAYGRQLACRLPSGEKRVSAIDALITDAVDIRAAGVEPAQYLAMTDLCHYLRIN